MPCNPVGAAERRRNQFDKIRRMEEVTAQVLALGNEEITAAVDAECAPMPEGSFEEIINPDAVHASLEKFMHGAEYRFALAVTKILKAGEAEMEEISLTVYEAGLEIALPPMDSAAEVYEALDLDILDGMPCDETRSIIECGEDRVSWRQTEDLHSSFWQQAGGNPADYTALLVAYTDGLLSGMLYRLRIEEDGTYVLAQQ